MTATATTYATHADLDVTTFYDTTVIDSTGRYALTLAILPDGARARDPLDGIADVAGLLGLELQFEVADVSYLPHALAAVLAGGESSQLFDQLTKFSELSAVGESLDVDPELLRFADYCTLEPVVAIEQSPLHKAVLAALVTAGAGVAVAAAPLGGAVVIAYFGGSILVGGGAIVVVQAASTWIDKRFGK